ncbi:MAG: VCBS repeat-containing protein, partial [Magnetococcales bacterium]|nr:VCBS repeat-containing protein [Magnetococcales bacterium]
MSDSISVLRNKGDGTFATRIDYTTGTSPYSVSSADVDGDGWSDLLVANKTSGTASVLRNKGDGTFATKVDYTTGSGSYSISAADVNGDGWVDMIVANQDANNVSVLLNNGQGTFIGKVNYAVGTRPYSVNMADVDGDGRPDLLVANQGSSTVSLLRNKGDGTFAAKVDYTAGTNPTSVNAADVDGDGRLDLLVANGGASTASILFNRSVPFLDFATVDDSGRVRDDNITSQSNALTLSLYLDSSDLKWGAVALYDDSNNNNVIDTGELLATTTASGALWTTDVSLAAGTHLIKAVPMTMDQTVMVDGVSKTLVIDTAAPIITFATPVDQSSITSLAPTLRGTIIDQTTCDMQLQIFDQTSKHYLVRKGGLWSDVGTIADWSYVVPVKNSGSFNWSLAADSSWPYNHVYTVTAKAIDLAGNETQKSVTFGYGAKIGSRITLTQQLYQINPEQVVTLQGTLERKDDKPWDRDISGQTVQLLLKSPDGTEQTLVTTTDATGQFKFSNLTGFSQKGSYTAQISNTGDPLMETAKIGADVRVGPPVGYVILVQGLLQTGSSAPEGLLAHKKSTNRIYQALLRRGFTADNIRYLNIDTASLGTDPAGKQVDYRNLPGVPSGSIGNPDFLPSRANIQNAIEAWAYDKMTAAAAPLYLVMVDHGGPETLYIGRDNNEGRISSIDLASWMNKLDSKLAAAGSVGKNALAQPQVAIVGSCYSGSFVDNLSRDAGNNKNRIVITSATAKERSFRGATEADGVQDGELFLQALFQNLGRGKSLYEAFTAATNTVESTPGIMNNASNASGNSSAERILQKIVDVSGQHPLLDDNGDKLGSNALATMTGQDGAVAKELFLGVTLASQSNSLEHQAQVGRVADPIYDIGNATHTLLWAQDNGGSGGVNASSAWVTVVVPNFKVTEGTAGSNTQISLDLPTGSLNYDATEQRWQINSKDIAGFAGFTIPGRYQLQYSVRDRDTGEVSAPVTQDIYKAKVGNHAPGTASHLKTLGEGGDSQQISQIGLFDWNDVVDPDQDEVSYNLVIAKDDSFSASAIVYQQQGLQLSQSLIDFNTIRDRVVDKERYYWRVETVDFYGLKSTSSAASFVINFQNDRPAILDSFLYNNSDYSEVAGATIKLNGRVIGSSASNGSLQALLPAAGGTLTIEKAGYKTQSIPLTALTSGEVSQRFIAMEAVSSVASPTGLDLAAADDTGLSNSDNITKNSKSLTLSGLGIKGAVVTLLDGETSLGTVAVASSGKWSKDIVLSTGTHSIRTTQKVGGIVSNASEALSITVDTTPPAAPSMPDLDSDDDNGTDHSNNITSITKGLNFSGTTDIGALVTLFEDKNKNKKLDGAEKALATMTTGSDGRWRTGDLALALGTHSLYAFQSDVAGNASVASEVLNLSIVKTAKQAELWLYPRG